MNKGTIKDAYPLPSIQDTLDTLAIAKWFSTLDLAVSCWQVELTPQSTQSSGLRHQKWTARGECYAIQTVQCSSNIPKSHGRVLVEMQWETCLVYLDNIIVLGRDVSEMLERQGQVFSRLRQANLKLKPAKCCLFHRQVAYLGHIVAEDAVATDPSKVQKV